MKEMCTGSADKTYSPESHIMRPSPEWVGGMFEAGGGMGFNIKKTGRRTITPHIQYTDDSLDRISFLQHNLGGSIVSNSRGTYWTLSLYSHKAVAVALASRQHMPSRSDMLAAFELWSEASPEEKLAIAEQLDSPYGRSPDLRDTSYSELLEDNEFLAGVLDARGTVIPYRGRGDKSHPLLALSSTNHTLVRGLKEKFGGSLIDSNRKANPRDSRLSRFLVWRVTNYQHIGQIIDSVKNNLRFRDKIMFDKFKY